MRTLWRQAAAAAVADAGAAAGPAAGAGAVGAPASQPRATSMRWWGVPSPVTVTV
jgi:hypothetical protein